MIKELVKDVEFLSKPAQPATIDDLQVAEDLRDTMASLENCACLAANQIGSDKAIIAYAEDSGAIRVMFNPKLKAFMQPYRISETCMTLDEPHEVKRFNVIKVAYEEPADGKLVPRSKRLVDWEAQIVQHAIDHCAGKLV
jgi:peptide deformylase